MLARDGVQNELGIKLPPEEKHEEAAERSDEHHMPPEPQVGVGVGDQSLSQQRDADHLAEILQQPHPRFYVNARIKVAEMDSEDNAGYDESGAEEASLVKIKRWKIRAKVPIGRKEKHKLVSTISETRRARTPTGKETRKRRII